MRKTKILLSRPEYVGFCVLEHSKLSNYEFFYDYMKTECKKYAEKIRKPLELRLLYQDTDSMALSLTGVMFHDVIRPQIENYFDTSDIDEKMRRIYNFPRVNKKVLGKWKDEFNGHKISKFIALRAKSYAVEIFKNGEFTSKNKHKGVSKSVTKLYSIDTYEEVLREDKTLIAQSHRIKLDNFKNRTVLETKSSLNSHDNKRYRVSFSNTIAHGHKDIIKNKPPFGTIEKNNNENIDSDSDSDCESDDAY